MVDELKVEEDENNPLMLYIRYPNSKNDSYVMPLVKLELGPIAAKTPSELKEISPYYSRYFNLKDDDIAFNVNVVSIQRTFWEKILILYSETNRPNDKMMPPRYFRHYYDVAMIYASKYFENIVLNYRIFEEAKLFNSKYYYHSWAKIEDCNLETITIYPNENRIVELRRDYIHMRNMFFGTIPSFEDVMAAVKALETKLRKLVFNK